MTREKHRRHLRVLTWNTEVGRNGADVLKALRFMAQHYRPDVIALQEARPYRDEVARLHGYTAYYPKGKSGEAGDTITLLRDPAVARAVSVVMRALRMKSQWHGPKAGKLHHARIFPEVTRDWFTVVNVHRTRPSWSADGAAFVEEDKALSQSAEESPTDVWICVGDQNIGTRPGDKRLAHGPWALAKAIGANVITTDPGHVDYAIGRGVRGTARRLDNHGSDHGAVLIDLEEIR